ncbi:DUF2931 family protein [Flavobacterium aquidurense]|uniref:DUF2931 family protein n=1 Tax=Flavobacterium aquidurense TaxID=362413 RepID=UPI002862353D|nr:DUF2931 family protein [Flavobacterium aquidurense]MDR7369756.1 hypothetical protein [Flavobacterium aquidurense]
MKNKFKLIILFALLACNNKEDMSTKTDFSWGATVASVKDYPIEVHKGYLATQDKFITNLHGAGIEDDGWGYDGTDIGAGGNIIPTMLSLTWVSYAEKKFWKIDTNIDQTTQNKMLALFREGFYNWNSVTNLPEHETYNHITIAVVPGGMVVLFITGAAHRVEVARYQAKETYVDLNTFLPVPGAFKDLETFYDIFYKGAVPKYLQQKIYNSGIPYGIWDTYREKYNWRFQTSFYKEDDSLHHYSIIYINGEEDNIYQEVIDKALFNHVPLPLTISFYFKIYNGEAKFDEDEIVAAFKKMKKNHPDATIEIEIRPAFMYKTTSFTVKCGGEEILLEKTIVKMYKN